MAKKRKRRRSRARVRFPGKASRRKLRLNPGQLTEAENIAQEEMANAIPDLVDIIEDIKDDASDQLGYDVDEHPGIDYAIMRQIREELYGS